MYLICFCWILFEVAEIIILHSKRPNTDYWPEFCQRRGDMGQYKPGHSNSNSWMLAQMKYCFSLLYRYYITSSSVQKWYKSVSSKNIYVRISVLWNSDNACKTPGRVWEKENTTMHFVRCGLGCGFFVFLSFQTFFQYLPEAFYKLTEKQVDGTLSKL